MPSFKGSYGDFVCGEHANRRGGKIGMVGVLNATLKSLAIYLNDRKMAYSCC